MDAMVFIGERAASYSHTLIAHTCLHLPIDLDPIGQVNSHVLLQCTVYRHDNIRKTKEEN